MLRAENICKRFDDKSALDNVCIEVKRGEIYGLLGPNGAGKTTLLRIINRIIAPDSGTILLEGQPIQPSDVSRIGYMPEERGLYKEMKVGEQIVYLARLKGMSKQEAVCELQKWLSLFYIEGWANRKIVELSKGMAQKVQFIATVIHKPDLLIFDEPFSGVDPVNTELLKKEILRLRDSGTSIILSTHDMSSVEEMCDNITLLNKGQSVLSGRIEDIRNSYGSNIYEVGFIGNIDSVKEAIGSCATILQEQHDSIITSIRFGVESREALREVVGKVNELTDIRSLNEIIPSMNDIFIGAVTQK